jgi:hypothetical protein
MLDFLFIFVIVLLCVMKAYLQFFDLLRIGVIVFESVMELVLEVLDLNFQLDDLVFVTLLLGFLVVESDFPFFAFVVLFLVLVLPVVDLGLVFLVVLSKFLCRMHGEVVLIFPFVALFLQVFDLDSQVMNFFFIFFIIMLCGMKADL